MAPRLARGARAPHRLRLTLRGWSMVAGALAAIVAAYAIGWSALFAVALFGLGLTLVALVWVLAVPMRLDATRTVAPDVVEVGGTATSEVRVAGFAAGASRWAERLDPGVEAVGPASGVLEVRQGREAIARTEVRGRSRGVVVLGPLLVTRSDPFGLASAARGVGPSATLTVLPRVEAVRPPRLFARSDAEAVLVGSAGGDERDVVAREYRPGDPMRTVDWRATAHRGELMVRSEVAGVARATGLALDTRSEMWPDEEAFEFAVTGVASLAAAIGADGVVRVAVGGESVEGVRPALEALAAARRGGGGSLRMLEADLRAGGTRAVRIVTGPGAVGEIAALHDLPSAVHGVVSIVGERSVAGVSAVGWHVERIDPSDDVASAWSGRG